MFEPPITGVEPISEAQALASTRGEGRDFIQKHPGQSFRVHRPVNHDAVTWRNPDMHYFTEGFLLHGNPGWTVNLGTATPPSSYVGGIVKHHETGYVWVITDEPAESWRGQRMFLGRWPD